MFQQLAVHFPSLVGENPTSNRMFFTLPKTVVYIFWANFYEGIWQHYNAWHLSQQLSWSQFSLWHRDNFSTENLITFQIFAFRWSPWIDSTLNVQTRQHCNCIIVIYILRILLLNMYFLFYDDTIIITYKHHDVLRLNLSFDGIRRAIAIDYSV